MFSGIPTTTFGASIVMCHLSLLVSARVLDDFRGISCSVIFNVTRAVLETLPSHVHLVALLSQRAAVKSRLTQQRFVLWLRRLHELANPQSFEPSFPLSCCLVFRFCEAVFCVPPLFGRGSPSLRETLFGPDSARNIVAQIENCSQVL